jgi:putative membrane protein
MKNKYFNTFIRKITDKETKESKICISNFPQDIIFELINYIRNYWNGGYSGYVYIREKINIKNRVMIHEISLSYCIFEKDFAIENSKIREMSLNKSIFDQKVSFSKSIFKYDVLEEENHSKQPFESGSFLETKFKGIVDFSNTSLYGVKFENVDFIGEGKNIYFQNSSLYDIKFKNVNFNFSTYFYNSEIEKLSFEDTTFRGNTNFREISFNGETKFLNCTFTSLQNDASEEVSFSESIFKQEANFSGSIFDVKANFLDTKFGIKQEDNLNENNSEVKFLFENAKFQKEINFSKAIFYDTIYFSGTEFCIDIKEYVEKSINFENAQFRRKVRFHHCKFHNTVRFENTLFNKLADFYSAHFHKAQQFHFTDFLDRAIFSNTEFDQEVQFLHCKVTKDSYVRFESAIFNKGLDISRSNFNDKVNFWNIEIKEGDIFTSSKYADDFEVHKNEINPEKNIPSVYKQLRETYRIIKDNLYKQNNKIEGLHFSEKEMSVYLEEKRAEDSKTKQEKEKNDLLIQESKASVSVNSSKKSFKNIKKKYVRIYEDLSLVKVLFLIIFLVLEFLFSPILLFLCIFQTIYLRFKYVLQKIRNVIVIPIKKLYFYIRIFIRICFYRLLSLKNKSDFLFMFAFLVITLASGIVYIIVHKYIWYWITLFLFALWVYLEFYHNRRNIKYTIRSNNYISLVLLCIPMMLIFIMLYGVNDYENDLIYKILSFIFSQFSMMFKDNEIFKFFLITILIFIAIIFSIISKKQDKLLLWFNKNSNIFDTDWVVGVNFTILVTLIAYIVILSLNPNLFFLPSSEGVGNFLRGLVDVLNITDWRYIKILGKTPTNWQYVFLFIGRIFVAYGIYQTVQAFRKFGKS